MTEGLEITLAHLDAKSRLVLPKKIRDKTGIEVGDVVFVYGFENLVLLRKAQVDQKPVIETIRRLGEWE